MRELHFIFVHGTFGQGSDWKLVRDRLHHILDCSSSVLDLPGHAARPLDTNQDAFEQLVHALRDELKQPSIIVGYSLGGRVALHAALRTTSSIPLRGLVLEGANPGLDDMSLRTERAHLDDRRAQEIERDGLTAFLDRWYRLPLFGFAEHDAAARTKLVKNRATHQDPSAIARILREASPGRVPSLWPELSRTSVPLAFIHGSKDKRYADIGARLRVACPHAHVHSITDAGHNTHDENPEAFAEVVAAFAQHLARSPA